MKRFKRAGSKFFEKRTTNSIFLLICCLSRILPPDPGKHFIIILLEHFVWRETRTSQRGGSGYYQFSSMHCKNGQAHALSLLINRAVHMAERFSLRLV